MNVLEKRTYDERTYDIDCVDLLAADETITSITEIVSDEPTLVLGVGTINAAPITYEDGHTSGIGKVVQVVISGGEIGVPTSYVDCIIRCRVVTSNAPQLEATVTLRLKDTP